MPDSNQCRRMPEKFDFDVRPLHIATLEDARRELGRIGADPAGTAMMAGKMLQRCLRLGGLECRQANILKQEMLSLGGDAAVARGAVSCSIPSSDVILIGTEKQLRLLCDKLASQPFRLKTLAAEVRRTLDHLAAPPDSWLTSRRELSLRRPLIMGILNITPDSFSDGSLYLDPQRALDRALEMADQGADIIDIGGESTRPGAPPVPAEEELRRVAPVIEKLAGKLSCAISVDTWKAAVAQAAINAGAEIINDISGFTFDPAMAQVAAQTGAAAVLMHTRGEPDTMQQETGYPDLLVAVTGYLQKSLAAALAAGIKRERLALDPGIGFAKDTKGNLELLRRLDELRGFGLPLLVGTSRKSFIGRTLNRETGDRLPGTAATVALAIASGASILRVHDVREMRDVADMAYAITFAQL